MKQVVFFAAILVACLLGMCLNVAAQQPGPQDVQLEKLKAIGGLVQLHRGGEKDGTIRLVTFWTHDFANEDMSDFIPEDTVEELQFWSCRVDDKQIDQLSRLKNLRKLTLDAMEIDDEDLGKLSNLGKLEHLSLGSTEVTDDGVKYLEGMKHLRVLSVSNTEVSTEMAKLLSKRLPQLERLNWYTQPSKEVREILRRFNRNGLTIGHDSHHLEEITSSNFKPLQSEYRMLFIQDWKPYSGYEEDFKTIAKLAGVNVTVTVSGPQSVSPIKVFQHLNELSISEHFQHPFSLESLSPILQLHSIGRFRSQNELPSEFLKKLGRLKRIDELVLAWQGEISIDACRSLASSGVRLDKLVVTRARLSPEGLETLAEGGVFRKCVIDAEASSNDLKLVMTALRRRFPESEFVITDKK